MPAVLPTSESPAASPEAEWLLRQLTRSVAHNLNNRLTGVIGCLEGTLEAVGEESPLSARLQVGLTCALQAAEMVRRMIMFAFKPEGALGTALVNLGETAESAARRVREQHLPGLKVEVVRVSTTSGRANAVLVQLALDQLIDNAIEAMPEGGTLTLQVQDDGPDICLKVKDTGPGLSDEAAAHLFEPFVTTRCAGHLGLGLVLCRDLVQAQGGTLSLTWETGKGTTAALCFPAVREDNTDPPPRREQASPSSPGTLWHVI